MRRFTGIRFDTVPPERPDTLPRMDVPAFVGFASCGPVDVPVAVEDAAQFQDIFGDDPILAWDVDAGRTQRGYLGSTVRAFFASGGRRCWVVRVAEAPRRCVFTLPGLRAVTTAGLSPAHARARAPGSWARALSTATTLVERRLPRVPDSALSLNAESSPAGRLVLEVEALAAPGEIEPGQLLRLTLRPGGLLVFAVLTATRARRGVLLSARQDPEGPPALAFARLHEGAHGAAAGRSATFDLLTREAGLAAYAAWRAQPERGAVLDRLSFELATYRGRRLAQRIEGLAFAGAHLRCWAALPSDEQLFAHTPRPLAPALARQRDALRAEALGEAGARAGAEGGRFPLAGPADYHGGELYLPYGMSLGRSADGAREAEPASAADEEGLAAFTGELFFDARLSGFSGEGLLRNAEALALPARAAGPAAAPLRGMHSLLGRDEVTLIAVPDAAHRAWTRERAEIARELEAPELHPVEALADHDGWVELRFGAVEGATAYEIAASDDPDFTAAQALVVEEGTTARARLWPSCAPRRFFRVRALRHAEPSAWSGTRVFVPRAGGFLPCEELVLPELALALDGFTAAHEPRLRIAPRGGSELAPGLTLRVETASNALFAPPLARFALPDGALTAVLAAPQAVLYARVRAERSGALGPWSGTLTILPGERAQPRLRPLSEGFDARLLVAVHRALLRFCHARGDTLALLSLPRHFGAEEVRAQLAAVLPGEPGAESDALLPLATLVPRLTGGEAESASDGALFHPWVALGSDTRAREEPPFIPPDGVVAGLLSRTARDEGPWSAIANRVLSRVLASGPHLDEAQRAALSLLPINLVEREARGFVLASDRTLSLDAESRSISVRRLLALIKRLSLREGGAYVFEPYTAEFAGRVRHRFQRMLSNLHLRGALRGTEAAEAFRVVVDASVNPPESVDLGRFVVELRVAPSRPLSFLRVRLVQTGPERLSVGEA